MRRFGTPHTLWPMGKIADAFRRSLAPWCTVCGVEPGDPVCPGCLEDFFPQDVRRCRRCGNRLPIAVVLMAEKPVETQAEIQAEIHVDKPPFPGDYTVDKWSFAVEIPVDKPVDVPVDTYAEQIPAEAFPPPRSERKREWVRTPPELVAETPACPQTRPGSAPSARIGQVANRNRMHDDGELCGRCLAYRWRFDATLALADYAAPVRGMIAALKFQGRLDLGRAFGLLLARYAAQRPEVEFDALIPIPVAPQRLRGRGYNQAEEIARGVAAGLRRPVLARHLIRVQDGPAQHDLPLAQRRTAIRGAFALRLPLPRSIQCAALVDDVMTSGSTLDEAARVLKHAGVERVINLVVARTP